MQHAQVMATVLRGATHQLVAVREAARAIACSRRFHAAAEDATAGPSTRGSLVRQGTYLALPMCAAPCA
jgi:hypothetical protein